jgi:hypothetical protein
MGEKEEGGATCTDSSKLHPCTDKDDARWLALLIRQGLKVIIAGIDARYGESRSSKDRRQQAA